MKGRRDEKGKSLGQWRQAVTVVTNWEWVGGVGGGKERGSDDEAKVNQDIARHHNKVVQVRGNWLRVWVCSQVPIEVG